MNFTIHLKGMSVPKNRPRLHISHALIKYVVVMKLFIAILICSLNVSATVYSQQINLNVSNGQLRTVLQQLRKQSGYSFVFKSELLKVAKPVTVHLQQNTLEEALQQIFKDQPLGYRIENKTISIQPKTGPSDHPQTSVLQKDISGIVTDEKDLPVPGVTVILKNQNNRVAITDPNGHFYFQNAPDEGTLIVRLIGYATQEINYSGNKPIKIQILPTDAKLDEVQVIAYGTTSARLNPGNIGVLKGEDIAKQPVDNPLLALSGRIPGVFISQSSGIAGGGVKIQIQGQNSIGQGNEPFYVIDGVPYASQLATNNLGAGLLGTSGYTSSVSGNPLNFINPNDIESITVLKDADATAIYGSRAANGAILITTRKAIAGKIKTTLNLQQGIGEVTRRLDLMNTQQYLQMRKEAIKNDGQTISTTDYDVNGFWNTTRYTDWQKELLGHTAHYTNINASFTGGNAIARYLVGGTYKKETTVFPGNFNDQKAALHFDLNSNSENQKFHFDFSTNFMFDNNQLPGTDLTPTAIRLPPDAPSLYNSDGSLNWMPNTSGSSTWTNPLAPLNATYSNKTYSLISNSILSYEIIKNLKLLTNLGYTRFNSDEIKVVPLSVSAPENLINFSRSANYATSSNSSWIIEPQLTYNRTIFGGKLEALLGSTIQQNTNASLRLVGVGYISDQIIKDIRSATSISSLSNNVSQYKYNALFGRINYNIDQKYIFNFIIRRDGSSRFGAQNRFHNFGSIAGAWIFSEESPFKNENSFLSYGKIHASIGTTGNDQIGDYQYLNLFNTTTVGVPYQGITAISPNASPTNPYLQWENTTKINIGLDLGIFKNRILLNANYFNNRSSNELLQYSLPITSGFGSITKNFPAKVQNSGFELQVQSTNINHKNFSWSTAFNITLPQNKLLAFSSLASSPYANSLIIGQPISVVKLYKSAGVNPTTGIYQFYDAKGAITASPDFVNDKTIFENTMPKYYGGFQNTITYRNFELDFLFQYVKQIGNSDAIGSSPGSIYSNEPKFLLSRWRNVGDVTTVQKFYNSNFPVFLGKINALSSDLVYTDASYVRLKNLSISWKLPRPLAQKLKMESFKIFMQGQNLLTFTSFKGIDPENATVNNLPPLRILTIGIQASF